ncbi:Phosphoglycolate phosphatase [uncultured archaeon]|nr:Phosphoglycolate phosphatase [uncultured archaeon]
MAVKAIIFDIDGVLADSRDAVVHNTRTLLQEFGFIINDGEVERLSRAHSAESVLVSLAPSLSQDPGKLEKMLGRLSEITRENLGMVRPLPLAIKVPALSKEYRLAAATNRKTSAAMVLEKLGIAQYFKAVLTSDDAPAKPHPGMIGLALKKLRVQKSEAVFIGDNIEDRQAGEAAGVRTFVVNGADAASVEAFLREFLPGQ